jgi:plasmid stabilization system protein ParE
MIKYTVLIMEKAKLDISKICMYISSELSNPLDANRQGNRIYEAISTLSMFPKRIHLVDFEPQRTQGYRSILIDNYAAAYFIKEDNVVVTGIFYGHSNIEKRMN